jgi:hypothetical protein
MLASTVLKRGCDRQVFNQRSASRRPMPLFKRSVGAKVCSQGEGSICGLERIRSIIHSRKQGTIKI